MHARDFEDPAQRITHRTAYTVQKHEARIDAGVVGLSAEDLGINLGVVGGVTKRFQLGANFGHVILGVANVGAKVNAVDTKHFGLGISADVSYARPRAIWVVPKSLRDDFGPGHLLSLPIIVRTSYPVVPWLRFDLGLGYRYASAFGQFDPDSFFATGGLTTQQVFFEPGVAFYLGKRVALNLYGHLAAYTSAQVAATAESELGPGVVGGVTTVERRPVPFADTQRYALVIETRFGATTHMQVGALYGGFFSKVGGWPVMPAINFYWRVGGPRARRPKRAEKSSK